MSNDAVTSWTLPKEGVQHSGLSGMADTLESALRGRTELRRRARRELEDQSMQQLRQCVEKFVQKEAASRQVQQEDEDRSLAFGLAAVLISVLQLRQHRHVLDTLRRQFHDF